MRGFFQISQKKLPKRAFRRDASDNFHRNQASKMIISREVSSTIFTRTWCFQNERFARMLPTIFTEKASKMIDFVRGFLQISQNKLPKRAFRAMLPSNFTRYHASKNERFARWRDAGTILHRKSFQNDFVELLNVRGCLSGKFQCRTSFLCSFPNFLFIFSIYFQTSVSRDASDNFHQKFAFRYSFARSTHRFLREGSSAKSKMCLALQRRGIPKFQNVRFATAACAKMYDESIDREPDPLRARKNVTFYYSFGRSAPRSLPRGLTREKMTFAFRYSFWAIDTTFLPRGLIREKN